MAHWLILGWLTSREGYVGSLPKKIPTVLILAKVEMLRKVVRTIESTHLCVSPLRCDTQGWAAVSHEGHNLLKEDFIRPDIVLYITYYLEEINLKFMMTIKYYVWLYCALLNLRKNYN